LIGLLQSWEDGLIIGQRENEFEQRVIAAMLPHDPSLKLPKLIFKQDEPHLEQREEGLFLSPTTPEEFDEMMRLFEEEDRRIKSQL
jgi:hypothetical protein